MYHARDLFDFEFQKEACETKFPRIFLVFMIVMMGITVASAVDNPANAVAAAEEYAWQPGL